MGAVAQRMWRPLSVDALLPLTDRDKRRYFEMVTITRSIAIAVLGTVLLWSFRDSSPVVLVAVALWMYPAIAVTWVMFRHSGVLAPHVWARDIVTMSVFAALVPDYLVVAMMTCLAILSFNCYTAERRTTLVLSIGAVVGMTCAAAVHVSDMSVLGAIVFPLAILAIILPAQLSADAMQRSAAFNASIADNLEIAMFESIGVPGEPTSMIHLFAGVHRDLGPSISEQGWLDLLHPDDRDASDRIDAAVAEGRDYRERYRQRATNGVYRWIEEIGRVKRVGDGVKVYGMTRDVSAWVETESQLTRLDRMADMVDISISVLRLVDPDDPTSLTVVWENQKAQQVDRGSHVGQRVIDFNRHTFDVERHRGLGYRMAETAAGGGAFRVPDAHIRLEGQDRLFSLVCSPLPDLHCAVVMQDVTELWSARSELERVAFEDPLTGLPNRPRFRHVIADAPVGSTLFVMDLDRFTDVNEAFGHGCGDEMIAEVARLLADAPEGVTVARLGGDEFGILVPPGIGARDDLVGRIFHALTRPVVLPNGLTLQASASMGITTKTKADMPADELLRQADVALNHAKRFRNAHEVYDPRTDTSAPHRMMLLGELRRALTNGELELHHQPAVDTTTGQICSVESKLVWRHPSLGLLTTEELTEMVDISNLHADIVMHSLREAVAHYTAWQRAGRAVPVSINVNGATVHDTALITRIIELVQRADLPPNAIGIEICEQHLMLGRGTSLESLRQLSAAGIWVTIDHFGSAITSLSVLRRCRANALKLDRQGINDLKPIGSELMSAMIAACRSFGVLVAADGADTRSEFEWLVELGASQVQGDFVGPTVTFEEIQVLLRAHEAISVRR